jgi:hypothetical protein
MIIFIFCSRIERKKKSKFSHLLLSQLYLFLKLNVSILLKNRKKKSGDSLSDEKKGIYRWIEQNQQFDQERDEKDSCSLLMRAREAFSFILARKPFIQV